MKTVKLIISFFLISICLIFGGEIFQKYISTYTNQFYYLDISTENTKEKTELTSVLQKYSYKYGVNVFAVSKKSNSAFSYTTTIYASDGAAEFLESKYGIYQGFYKSLFSGSTEIIFNDFDEIVKNKSIDRYYFTGSDKDVVNIKAAINSKFPSSYVHKENTVSNDWLITAVWLLSGALILLLTWFDIQFKKKESFILISLGVPRGKIILKNALSDSLAFCCMYAGLYFALHKYTYVNYKLDVILPVFFMIIVVNAALYLVLYKVNFKEVLYGANINASTVSNCYVLKALTMLVTVTVLSSNIILITDNSEALKQYKKIEEYKDYSFLSVNMYLGAAVNEDDFVYQESTASLIFSELYKKNKAAIAIYDFGGVDYSCIMINNNTSSFMPEINELKVLNLNKDYYILIPSEYKNRETVSKEVTEYVKGQFGELQTAEYETITYKGNKKVLYLESSKPVKIPLGFALLKNPVIVYCNFSPEALKAIDTSSAFIGSYFKDIMFKVTEQDIVEIEEKYDIKAHGLYLSHEKVIDRFEYSKASVMRNLLLNTVISIFMLLLEMAIISTLVKFEYKVHAIELSIKKILGYPLYRKNKKLFWLNIYATAIGIITVVIISLMYKYSLWYVVIISGIALLTFEYLIIALNVLKLEMTSVPRILKGGSL